MQKLFSRRFGGEVWRRNVCYYAGSADGSSSTGADGGNIGGDGGSGDNDSGGLLDGLVAGIKDGLRGAGTFAATISEQVAPGFTRGIVGGINDTLADWGVINGEGLEGGRQTFGRLGTVRGISTSIASGTPAGVISGVTTGKQNIGNVTYGRKDLGVSDPSAFSRAQSQFGIGRNANQAASFGDGFFDGLRSSAGEFLDLAETGFQIHNLFSGDGGQPPTNRVTTTGEEETRDRKYTGWLARIGAKVVDGLPADFKRGAVNQAEREYVQYTSERLQQPSIIGGGAAAVAAVAAVAWLIFRRK